MRNGSISGPKLSGLFDGMFSQPAEFVSTRGEVAAFTKETGEQVAFFVGEAEQGGWKTGHAMFVVLTVRSKGYNYGSYPANVTTLLASCLNMNVPSHL